MITLILLIMLTAHFLGDFTFQSAELAKKKREKLKYLIYHALIYAGVFIPAMFSFIRFKYAVLPFLIIITSHFLIDWIRTRIEKKYNTKPVLFASFVVDQALHILIITVTYYAFINRGQISNVTTGLFNNLTEWKYFRCSVTYLLILVTLWDAAGVFIKKLYAYIFDDSSSQDNDPKIGRVIGKLERIIVSILILYNQFGAIGFVLTAKSIARYKQLEDKVFAEKYLLGTLTSVLIAFIITIFFKRFL